MASFFQETFSRRRILCLDISEETIRPLLPDDQWEIVFANDLMGVRQAASDGAIRVLVARLGKRREGATLKLAEELLFERKDIKAVAIIEPGMLEEQRLRRSISSLFCNFLASPLDPREFRYAVGQAYAMASIICCGGKSEHCIETGEDHEILGKSEAMQRLRTRISRISTSDAPVMIGGESGTGKELAARNIHSQSQHGNAPFIAVNMATIPENLAQTELFGHEKGAFTGAEKKRIGYIESANGGTLFLDEIGDMPLQLQGNLLRFLQEGIVTRVGGTEVIPVDVRVISATHVNLEEAVSAGRFREDLYYRLNVLHLDMPPLRDRGGDIAYLAERFFMQFCSTSRCCAKGLSQRAIAVMKEHDWPGNVREMINRIQRAVVMCTDQLIHPDDLGLERRGSSRRIETLSDARGKVEKRLIQTALIDTEYNLSETSRLLGVSRVTLYKLIDKYQVDNLPQGAGSSKPLVKRPAVYG